MSIQTITLISGANKGIGFEIARGLAQAGHHVLVGCRSIDLGGAAAQKIRDEGGSAEPISLDVTRDESIAAAAKDIETRFGRLDVLVNNAGIALEREQGNASLRELLQRTYEVNVFGVACLTDAMAPLLAKSAHPRVVNMSSGLGSITRNSDPLWEFAHVKPYAYNSSKAAVNMLTVLFAARLADKGIKVNSADPGYCATDLNANSGYRTAAQGAAIAIHLATLDDGGPTGHYYDDAGTLSW